MYILSKILGDTYQAKILETLIENYEEEITIPEIIEIAETSRGSTYSYIKSLVSQGIVVETRKIGGTQLYRLDLENPATKAIILLEHNLVTSELEKEIAEEIKHEIILPSRNYEKRVIGVLGDRYSNKTLEPITYSESRSTYEEMEGGIKWEKMQKIRK